MVAANILVNVMAVVLEFVFHKLSSSNRTTCEDYPVFLRLSLVKYLRHSLLPSRDLSLLYSFFNTLTDLYNLELLFWQVWIMIEQVTRGSVSKFSKLS